MDALVVAAALSIITPVIIRLLETTAGGFEGWASKLCFLWDTIGRHRQAQMIMEQTRIAFHREDWAVNIAIWNVHLSEEHHFDEMLITEQLPMGKGGGFRMVVFLGGGYLQNEGKQNRGNWLWHGITSKQGNKIIFSPATGPSEQVESRLAAQRRIIANSMTSDQVAVGGNGGGTLTPRPAPGGGGCVHIVVADDTLWNISEKYYGNGNGNHFTEIMTASNITSSSLAIGQQLTIP